MRTIKENEIRIGNWYHHKAEWSYRQGTEELHEFDFQWNDTDWWALGECTLSLENIEPISLTEEWFIKFGFDKFSDYWHLYRHDECFDISWDLHFEVEGYKYSNKIEIEYVHLLQNLYFGIIQEEL